MGAVFTGLSVPPDKDEAEEGDPGRSGGHAGLAGSFPVPGYDRGIKNSRGRCLLLFLFPCFYFAYSVLLVSRMTLTRICPGYSICSSIRLAISFASTLMPSSVTSSGFTMMRTSRPLWIA